MGRFTSGIFSSLQFRLATGFVLALAVALTLIALAAGVVAGKQTERFERDQDSARVARAREFVFDQYAKQKDWDVDKREFQENLERAGRITGSRIIVYDSGGAVVADSHAALAVNLPARGPREKSAQRRGGGGFPVRYGDDEVGSFTVNTIAAGPGDPGIVEPAAARISTRVNRSLLWAGIGAAALGTLLVWLLSRRTLAPLQDLGEAARRLGRGDLSQRADTSGPREIQQLAHSFNVMATELEEAERHRRNLTADIAHELRTPLSNIQGYLEAMRDGLVQPTQETVDTIHGQAIQLSRLVEDLRLLALVESGDLRLQLSPVGMEQLLQSAAEAVRPRAEAKGVLLTVDMEEALPDMQLDATRISQVVGILLENAITHAPEGGEVSLSARAVGGHVEVAVADNGPGIAPEDLPRLFDRFYRADQSRSRETGGSGLGLTIARRLAEAHRGTIEVSSEPGRGSRFTVRLPAVAGGASG